MVAVLRGRLLHASAHTDPDRAPILGTHGDKQRVHGGRRIPHDGNRGELVRAADRAGSVPVHRAGDQVGRLLPNVDGQRRRLSDPAGIFPDFRSGRLRLQHVVNLPAPPPSLPLIYY